MPMASYADCKTQEATATSSSEYEPLPSGSKAPSLAEGAVLTQAEKRLLDAVDGVLGKLPWVKREGEADVETENSDDKDVLPHRFRSWEKNRESNVVLAFICGLLGAGRPQPSACERSVLLLLYASISYVVFFASFLSGPAACEASWVAQCVPPELGGTCVSQCAAPAVLAMKPAWVSYRRVLDGSPFRSLNFTAIVNPQAWVNETKAAAAWTPCMLPLCTDTSPCTGLFVRKVFCEPGGHEGRNAMCPCPTSAWVTFFGSFIVKLPFIKVLYVPALKVFSTDFETSPYCCLRMLNTILATFTVAYSGYLFWHTVETAFGPLLPPFVAKWLASFLVFTVFEAVKGFLLGHVIGYYFVRPLCPACLWALWRNFFS